MNQFHLVYLIVVCTIFNILFAQHPQKKATIKKIASHTTSHSHLKLIEMENCLYIIKQKINIPSNPKSILKTVLLSKLIRKNPLLHVQEVRVISAKNHKYPKHYKNQDCSL